MWPGDMTYKAFRVWLEDYAKTVNDQYASAAGRYLLKVHVDMKERLKSDWNSTLGDGEFVGEAVIESKWPKGGGQMTVVEASQLRR